MTMRQLIILGLALAGVVHALEAKGAEEHDGDVEEEEEEGSEEPEDDVPTEPLSEETLKALFQKMDKDGDGKVAVSELLAFAEHMRTKRAAEWHEQTFEDMDTDKDGKLSLAEVTVGNADDVTADTAFKAADANGDGVLTKEESFAYHHIESSPTVAHAIAKFEMKTNDKDGDDKLNIDEFAELYGLADEEAEQEESQETKDFGKELFKHLDKNLDGFLDVKEMQAYETGVYHEEHSLTKMGLHADKDGDGFISLQELLSYPQIDEHGEASEHFFHMDSWATELEL